MDGSKGENSSTRRAVREKSKRKVGGRVGVKERKVNAKRKWLMEIRGQEERLTENSK